MDKKRIPLWAFLTGIPAGCLGGLIGLGGAEFRLPIIVGLFKYPTRKAVALNVTISLITVITSIIFRLPNTPINMLSPYIAVILSIIAGAMTGAYFGAGFTNKISDSLLKRIIFVLLLLIGCLLLLESFIPFVSGGLAFTHIVQKIFMGILCGLFIGFICSLLGVAGGELIIPTLILLFGVDVVIAGTASLLISLPTVMIGIAKHKKNKMYKEKSDFTKFVFPMGIGSVIGVAIGASLMVVTPSHIIKFVLGLLLISSAIKIFFKKSDNHAK